jgi:translation initiation factor 2B subunit (eIF-2B alpha/beta/delta family)
MVISNLQKAVKKIATDKRSGATELTVKAVEIYLKYLKLSKVGSKNKFLDELAEIGNLLRVAQPSMISITNIVELVADQAYTNAQKMNLSELKHIMSDYLIQLNSEIINAKKCIAKEALNLIPMDAVIITLS